MTQYQDYTLTIRRAPTLKELRVTEENGSAAALEKFDESTKSYTWLVLGQQVTLTLIPTETEGYELYVDGENVTETGSCTVLLEETEKTVTVELKAGGKTTQYTLLLRRTDSCVVRIPVDSADMEMTEREDCQRHLLCGCKAVPFYADPRQALYLYGDEGHLLSCDRKLCRRRKNAAPRQCADRHMADRTGAWQGQSGSQQGQHRA